MKQAWKVLTHDLRSPIQRGEPIWNGLFPFRLPQVTADPGPAECAAGWNCCERLSTAFGIAGWWPLGRPGRAFLLEELENPLVRGKKLRCNTALVTREATEQEIVEALFEFSAVFGAYQADMAEQQAAWRRALARLGRVQEQATILALLQEALTARGLSWTIHQFDSGLAVRDTWATRAVRNTCDAWGAWAALEARDAWATRVSLDALDARAARAARAALEARDAWGARVARYTCDAWGAQAALTVYYAAINGWIVKDKNILTVGLREAYRAGVEIVLPTGPNELGWARKPDESEAKR